MTPNPLGYYSVEPSRVRPRTRHGVASFGLFAVAAVVTALQFVGVRYGMPYGVHLALFAAGLACMVAGTVIGFAGIISRGRTWLAFLGFALNGILLLWVAWSILVGLHLL